MSKVELLVPAGSLEKVKWAVHYGADAIYIGGENFSLRANASNFSLAEIKQATTYCHEHQVKLFVALNIIFHEQDYLALDEYLKQLEIIGVDALIMSDIGAIKRALKLVKTEIHVSTQASILNLKAAIYYESIGVKRIVLARECDKNTIKDIINNTNLEVEVFIHGAMCSSFSGRCTLSNTMTNRDANHGGCSQVCRFDFDIYQGDSNITSDFPFALAAKDLMMAEYIKDMIEIGVHSLKIEGRMRSLYYIAMITNAYRNIIDNLEVDLSFYIKRLQKCANREAIPQFYHQEIDQSASYYNGRTEVSNQDFLGITLEYDETLKLAKIEERNTFKIGDKVTFFGPDTKPFSFVIKELLDEEKMPLDRAYQPHQIVYIKVPKPVRIKDLMHIHFT